MAGPADGKADALETGIGDALDASGFQWGAVGIAVQHTIEVDAGSQASVALKGDTCLGRNLYRSDGFVHVCPVTLEGQVRGCRISCSIVE